MLTIAQKADMELEDAVVLFKGHNGDIKIKQTMDTLPVRVLVGEVFGA